MARARNIKPGFFTNDVLAEIDPLGRLLFIGMWTIADKSGRLEDRPKRIKAEVLPYDDCDIDSLLNDLQRLGFIYRYRVCENFYIQILNFTKHQNPHMKEAESTIPAPCQHSADEVLEQEMHGSCRADSGFPLTDSLNPINNPDGLFVGNEADAKKSPAKPSKPDCPHQKIIDLYHEILPVNPVVKVWNDKRASHLRARWNEDPKRQNLDYWRMLFEYIATCDFLVGKTKTPFFASLAWIVQSENFAKIIEQNYENKR